MELGIGLFGDMGYDLETKEFQNPADKLNEVIEQVGLADELGVDLVALGEHHREDYSIAAPEIILSALSTVTKRIKLASGVSIVSSADPVKLYQDFASIDLLSNERAEIIAGRGSFTESFPLFGYDLKDYHGLFEEKLDLLHQLNNNKVINWEGNYRAPIVNQTIYPQPNRKLPIWIAVGGTPQSVQRAAKYGMPVIFAIIGGRYKDFKNFVDLYRELYVSYGHDPAEMEIGVHSHFFIGDSKEDLVENYYPHYAAQMDRVGRTRGWAPYSRLNFEAGMSKEGALVMGSTEEVTEKTISIIEHLGVTRFVAHIDTGGPSQDMMKHTIREYAEKVIPAVREHFK